MKSFLLIILTLLIFVRPAESSGYHPSFDKAVEQAEIIVAGEIVDSWHPHQFGLVQVDSIKVYKMKVSDVYKGDLKPGDDIIYLDPYFLSTASYFVDDGGRNLAFLIKAEPETPYQYGLGKYDPQYDYGIKEFYVPIENVSGEHYSGWKDILDIRKSLYPQEQLALYRKILQTETNRYKLSQIIEDWPGPLTEEDKAIFKGIILRFKDDALISGAAIRALAEEDQFILGNEELLKLFQEGSEYMRSDMLKLVNESNISAVQDLIFDWALDPREYASDFYVVIPLLHIYAPKYLKERLKDKALVPGKKQQFQDLMKSTDECIKSWKNCPCQEEACGIGDWQAKYCKKGKCYLNCVYMF